MLISVLEAFNHFSTHLQIPTEQVLRQAEEVSGVVVEAAAVAVMAEGKAHSLIIPVKYH